MKGDKDHFNSRNDQKRKMINRKLRKQHDDWFNSFTPQTCFDVCKFLNMEIDLTYQCNQKCPKCVRLCNTPAAKVFAKQSTLTMEMIFLAIDQIRSYCIKNKIQARKFKLIGGEPTLHPNFEEIFDLFTQMMDDKIVQCVEIWTNGTTKVFPQLHKKSSLSWITIDPQNKQKIDGHQSIFISPKDRKIPTPFWLECNHLKCGITLSYNGYAPSPVCQTYARIFQVWDLFLDHIPKKLSEFPDITHKLCCHCPFNNNYFGRDKSGNISPTFARQLAYLQTPAFQRRNRNQPIYANNP